MALWSDVIGMPRHFEFEFIDLAFVRQAGIAAVRAFASAASPLLLVKCTLDLHASAVFFQ